MTVVLTINSVTTADAVPTATPHRLSDKATKTTATVNFTVTAASAIKKWVLRIEPTDHNTGGVLGKRGMVCGTGDLCGDAGSVALAQPSPATISEDVTKDETALRFDGDYNVVGYAAADEGWSA